MVSSRPFGYHQGDRAEYLVQYALSAIAAVIPVLRQEDYGVDFSCNLTWREKNSLYIGVAFGLQAKAASKDSIPYGVGEKGKLKPQEIDWLYSQDNPLFYISVNRDELILKIYSPSRIWRPFWIEGPPKTTILKFDIEEIPEDPPKHYYSCTRDEDGCPSTIISLGKPIIRVNLKEDDIEDDSLCSNLRECLSYWIELEKKNIINRRLDIPCFYEQLSWEINELPDPNGQAIFHAFNENPDQNIREVVAAVSPGITNLACSYIIQGQMDKIETIIPILDLLSSYDTPDKSMIDSAKKAAESKLDEKWISIPEQYRLSTYTGGGTGSVSGYQNT